MYNGTQPPPDTLAARRASQPVIITTTVTPGSSPSSPPRSSTNTGGASVSQPNPHMQQQTILQELLHTGSPVSGRSRVAFSPEHPSASSQPNRRSRASSQSDPFSPQNSSTGSPSKKNPYVQAMRSVNGEEDRASMRSLASIAQFFECFAETPTYGYATTAESHWITKEEWIKKAQDPYQGPSTDEAAQAAAASAASAFETARRTTQTLFLQKKRLRAELLELIDRVGIALDEQITTPQFGSPQEYMGAMAVFPSIGLFSKMATQNMPEDAFGKIIDHTMQAEFQKIRELSDEALRNIILGGIENSHRRQAVLFKKELMEAGIEINRRGNPKEIARREALDKEFNLIFQQWKTQQAPKWEVEKQAVHEERTRGVLLDLALRALEIPHKEEIRDLLAFRTLPTLARFFHTHCKLESPNPKNPRQVQLFNSLTTRQSLAAVITLATIPPYSFIDYPKPADCAEADVPSTKAPDVPESVWDEPYEVFTKLLRPINIQDVIPNPNQWPTLKVALQAAYPGDPNKVMPVWMLGYAMLCLGELVALLSEELRLHVENFSADAPEIIAGGASSSTALTQADITAALLQQYDQIDVLKTRFIMAVFKEDREPILQALYNFLSTIVLARSNYHLVIDDALLDNLHATIKKFVYLFNEKASAELSQILAQPIHQPDERSGSLLHADPSKEQDDEPPATRLFNEMLNTAFGQISGVEAEAATIPVAVAPPFVVGERLLSAGSLPTSPPPTVEGLRAPPFNNNPQAPLDPSPPPLVVVPPPQAPPQQAAANPAAARTVAPKSPRWQRLSQAIQAGADAKLRQLQQAAPQAAATAAVDEQLPHPEKPPVSAASALARVSSPIRSSSPSRTSGHSSEGNPMPMAQVSSTANAESTDSPVATSTVAQKSDSPPPGPQQ